VWRSDNGDLLTWLMHGSSQTSSLAMNPSPVDPSWAVAGLADLDANGSTDILWRHTPTGWLYLWLMDGVVRVGAGFLAPSAVDNSWLVVATADFNGDRKADIVWQESTTGAIYIWFMDGVTRTSATFADPSQVAPPWRIVGASDFNNDGQPDLVFRHLTDGWVFVMYMNGATRIGGEFAYAAPIDINWQIVALGDYNDDGQIDIVWQHVSTRDLYVWYLAGVVRISSEYLTPMSAPANWSVVGRR
jgi:hypothetical protein